MATLDENGNIVSAPSMRDILPYGGFGAVAGSAAGPSLAESVLQATALRLKNAQIAQRAGQPSLQSVMQFGGAGSPNTGVPAGVPLTSDPNVPATGTGFVNAPDMSVAPPPSTAPAVAPGTPNANIYRTGNSYSDIPSAGAVQVTGPGAVMSDRSSGPLGGPDAMPTRQGYGPYGFTNLTNSGFRPSAITGVGGTVNSMPAANFVAPDSAGLTAARKAAADRGDFAAIAESYRDNGGSWMGKTADQEASAGAKDYILRGMRNAKTVTQQKNFIDAYHGILQTEATRANNTATNNMALLEHQRNVAKDLEDAHTKYITAVSNGNEKEAATLLSKLRLQLAVSAQANGYSPESVAGITAGRPLPQDSHVFLPSPTGTNQVIVGDRRGGGATLVTPKQVASEANIKASMTGQKLTREQAIQVYKDRGYDVSSIK